MTIMLSVSKFHMPVLGLQIRVAIRVPPGILPSCSHDLVA